MPDLVYTRNNNNTELSIHEVQRQAPAVFAEAPASTVTDRYAPISTLDAINIMRDHGWVPVQAAQKRARKQSQRMFGQHLVAFAHSSMLNESDRPELIAVNSHDGKSSLKLFSGWFRFICSNGCIAGSGSQSRLIHHQVNADNFEGVLRATVDSIPKVVEQISRMASTRLEWEEELGFAHAAMQTRWDRMPDTWMSDVITGKMEHGAYADANTAHSLVNHIRRRDDEFNDLWTVFNRVQENLIRGGGMIRSFSKRNPYGSVRTARPVSSVEKAVQVNRDLWDIVTNEMEAA